MNSDGRGGAPRGRAGYLLWDRRVRACRGQAAGDYADRMPISFELDRTAALIRTRCYGNVTLNDVLDHFQILRDEPDLPDRLDVFLDLRDITPLPTAEQMRMASEGPGVLKGIVSFRYCAIVADRDALFGMAHMWGVFAERFFTDLNVFRSVEEADAWLQSKRSGGRTARPQ